MHASRPDRESEAARVELPGRMSYQPFEIGHGLAADTSKRRANC